jgi:hypothetical protein
VIYFCYYYYYVIPSNHKIIWIIGGHFGSWVWSFFVLAFFGGFTNMIVEKLNGNRIDIHINMIQDMQNHREHSCIWVLFTLVALVLFGPYAMVFDAMKTITKFHISNFDYGDYRIKNLNS